MFKVQEIEPQNTDTVAINPADPLVAETIVALKNEVTDSTEQKPPIVEDWKSDKLHKANVENACFAMYASNAEPFYSKYETVIKSADKRCKQFVKNVSQLAQFGW